MRVLFTQEIVSVVFQRRRERQKNEVMWRGRRRYGGGELKWRGDGGRKALDAQLI